MYNLIIELNACAASELVKRMPLIHVPLRSQIQSRQYNLFKQCQLNILAGLIHIKKLK